MRNPEIRPEFPSRSEIGFVCDSTVSLSPREAARLRREMGIQIITLPSWIGEKGKEYQRDFTIRLREFYETLLVKQFNTAIANQGQFLKAFEVLNKKGVTKILTFHSDSTLTGGINSARAAAEIIKDKFKRDSCLEIYNLDTKTASAGAGVLIKRALEMALQGLSFNEICEKIEKEKEKVKLLIAVIDTVHFRNGIEKRTKIVGSLFLEAIKFFNVRPIITLESSIVKPVLPARGDKNAIARIVNLVSKEMEIRGKLKEAIIIHTGCEEKAKSLAKILKEEKGMEIPESDIWEAGPALAVYAGRCYGIACLFE